MRELAFLNKGIKIIFTDASQKKEKISEFKYDGGVLEFVDFLDEKREKLQNKNGNDLFRKPIYIEGKKVICVPVCFAFPTSFKGALASPF